MIRIAKLTEYAILILGQMAKEPSTTLSASYLADYLHLSQPTVSKILKLLADAGFVSSIRGSEGGYHLAKPAQDISVADVILAMEGTVAMTECCESNSLCHLESVCAMRTNWQKLNSMVHAVLAQFSVLDITGSPL